jgi:LmbE family N-acetylglucosaminyl deacetylase
MATVLFVSPHQDDESLSMGAAIRKHIEANHDVHVLLLCGGVESGAQANSGLSRPAFGYARDDEFIRATRQLGVPYENLHFARVTPADGTLTVQLAYDAILDFTERHDDEVWLKTYSNLPATNRHSDHINSGQAGLQALQNGLVANLRMYVEPWLISAFQNANAGVTLSTDVAADPSWVVKALDEYGIVDPKGQKFGIGFQSVSYFAGVKANPVSRYHLPVM